MADTNENTPEQPDGPTRREPGTAGGPTERSESEFTRLEPDSLDDENAPKAGAPEGTPADLPPSQQERYRLIRVLGKGGFANVYLAHDAVLDQDVAIKILKLGLASKSEQNRFLFEARIGAKLRHPNIITVLDILQLPEGLQMVMEYCPGGNLSETIKKRGALRPRESIAVIRQVANALGYAHRRNFVHRDVKPANIFLLDDGQVKLGDFGIAAYTDLHEHTMTGMIIGTPLYMAPEQATDSRDVDPRADIYSLGLTLYTTVTGHSPRVLDMDRVPAEFRPLIRQATNPDRNGRLVSADQFIAMLDQISQELVSSGAESRPATGAAGAGDEATPSAPTLAAMESTQTKASTSPPVLHASPGAHAPRWPVWFVGMAGALIGIALVVIALKIFSDQLRAINDAKDAAAAAGLTPTPNPRFGGRGRRGDFGDGEDRGRTRGFRGNGGNFREGSGDGRPERNAPSTATRGVASPTKPGATTVATVPSPAPTASAAASAPIGAAALPESLVDRMNELRRIAAQDGSSGNRLARAVALLDGASATPGALGNQSRQAALQTLRQGIDQDPAIKNDPISHLIVGIMLLRARPDPQNLPARIEIQNAFTLNQLAARPYDMQLEDLKQAMRLTNAEVAALTRLLESANIQFRSGPRRDGQRDGQRGGQRGQRQGNGQNPGLRPEFNPQPPRSN